MDYPKFSANWLYQTHDRATLARWARQLRYFRFVRAWGGHANDGDVFKANFAYAGRDDLLRKMRELGPELRSIPLGTPRPVVGQPYTGLEMNAFVQEIPTFPDLEQPGRCQLFGQRVGIWVNQFIELVVLGEYNCYEVTEADFTACLALEAYFDHLGWPPYLDRSQDASVQCVSPVHYPELVDA